MSANDEITLRFLAQPTDVTGDGSRIQAGSVLEWIDKAGYACAVGYCGTYCVTAYVGNVHYTSQIEPGSLIEAHARIIHTGRSSMQVLVSVQAADPRDREFSPAMDCLLVFVSVDGNGKPQPVRPLEPRGKRAKKLFDGAEERIRVRRVIHDLMREQEYTDAGTGPREVFRFLSKPTDVNWGGNAHGGTVMRWIDEVASTCATSWCGSEAVAVYSGGIHFYRPIRIGHLVELEARLIHTSARAMHVAIHVRSGDPKRGELELTTQCMSVFVTVGDDGRALPVPQLELTSDEDVRLDRHARDLVEQRKILEPIITV